MKTFLFSAAMIGLILAAIFQSPDALACDGNDHYDPAHDICQPYPSDQSPYYTPPPNSPYNPGPPNLYVPPTGVYT